MMAASSSSNATPSSNSQQQNLILSSLSAIATSIQASTRQANAPQVQDLKKLVIDQVSSKSIDNGPSTFKVTVDPNKVDSIENLHANI